MKPNSFQHQQQKSSRSLSDILIHLFIFKTTHGIVAGSVGLSQHELKLSKQIKVRSYIFLSRQQKSVEGFSLSSNLIHRLREASEISILSQP